LVLLTGSAVGHVALGGLGSGESSVSLNDMLQGESSIAVQLISSSQPPDSELRPQKNLTASENTIDRQDSVELPDYLIDDSLSEFESTVEKQQRTVKERAAESPMPRDTIVNNSSDPQPLESAEELNTSGPSGSTEVPPALKEKTIDLASNSSSRETIGDEATKLLEPIQLANPQVNKSKPNPREIPMSKAAESPERNSTPVEFEVESVIADASAKQGNATTDLVKDSMEGATTSPALDRKNPLNRPPVFPPELISKGVSGTVKLEVVVLASGSVESTKVLVSTGSTELDQVAQKAVAKWQFNPGLTNGVATAKRVLVPITFKIERRRAGVLKR
tara:strand:- start:1034 stop:2035 length:1002 start_codon:yes stop_codon:yes gene_type:complete